MLTKITLPFRSGAGLRYGYRTASLFHGLLMELVSPDYAVFLHENVLHPFSLHVDQAENGGARLSVGRRLWVGFSDRYVRLAANRPGRAADLSESVCEHVSRTVGAGGRICLAPV